MKDGCKRNGLRGVALAFALALALAARADFEVYFMRHGETSWNRAKVLQGSVAYTDITETGVGMAEDSAAEFRRRGIAFDAVYTSPYRRASHTAAIIAASQGLRAKDDARIRERCCGSCEGVRYASGEQLAELMRRSTGVESVEAVGDRAMDFLEKELAPLDGKVKRVLCVGHTLLLSVIEARLRGEREVGRDLLPNCCVHVLAFRNGRFSLAARAQVFYDAAKYAGRPKIRCVAHRGAGDLTMPEASRAAYADAVRKASDIVKLDLQMTKDGVIVMGHDPTLKRVMGWDAKIRDLDYAEILEKGRFLWKGKPTGERIVRLDEALEIVRPVPEFWIDFKYFDPDFAERALAAFRAKGIDESRLMVATFSKGALRHFQKRHPNVRRVGHIGMKSSDELPRVLAYVDELGLFGVNMPVLGGETTPAAVAELKRRKAWVSLWFVQNEKTAAKYMGSGCDAFVTDCASRVRDFVGARTPTDGAAAAEALKHRNKPKSKAFADRFHPTYPSVCDVRTAAARPVPDFLRSAVIYQLFTRMFTPEGTFAAAAKKLPELKDLGVNIIYLTPHQLADDDPDPKYWSSRQRASGFGNPKNPYRQKDFSAVDPEYGSADDLRAFVAAAHRLGLRVLFDLVYFHCGPTATLLKDHPDFVVRNPDGSPRLGGWAFPEMDHSKRAVREYLYANMIDQLVTYGADGFRCDVADMLPVDFWEEGARRCRAIRPDAILMCEGLKGDDQIVAFDLSYGFYVQWTMVELLKGRQGAPMLETAWRAERRDFPRGFHWMRCFENHDFANVNPGERRKEALYGAELNAAMIATCFLLDGVPMLYNGQEIADAAPHSIFSNRDHGGWHIDWSRADDAVARERRAFVKRLAKLRHDNPALFDAPVVWNRADGPGAYSFTRPLPDGRSVTLAVDLRAKRVSIGE